MHGQRRLRDGRGRGQMIPFPRVVIALRPGCFLHVVEATYVPVERVIYCH